MYASVQASANIWSIFGCRSNSVCTINKLNPLFGSDDIVRCLCIIFFRCFHLIFRIVVIFIAPHCQNTQSIDLSHGDWHVHACMKNKHRESASFYVCCHCRENGFFCHVILIVIDGLDIQLFKKNKRVYMICRERERKKIVLAKQLSTKSVYTPVHKICNVKKSRILSRAFFVVDIFIVIFHMY